jgi:hypothetical protein
MKATADLLTPSGKRPPRSKDATYIHTVLCQIGPPRAELKSLEYERQCRKATPTDHRRARLSWQEERLCFSNAFPFGTYARLIMTPSARQGVARYSDWLGSTRGAIRARLKRKG